METLKAAFQQLLKYVRPTALVICGIVIGFCLPTLQASSQILAHAVANGGKDVNPFTQTIATLTHHALLIGFAFMSCVLVFTASGVEVVLIVRWVQEQIRRARANRRRAISRTEKKAQKANDLPDNVTRLNQRTNSK